MKNSDQNAGINAVLRNIDLISFTIQLFEEERKHLVFKLLNTVVICKCLINEPGDIIQTKMSGMGFEPTPSIEDHVRSWISNIVRHVCT